MLRGIHYRDQHARFEQLYRIQDPWHMNTELEQFRFEQTNRLIRSNFGSIDTLLEVGCGEGHQTARLTELSTKLYAIDISARAVERARHRCPNVTFGVGDIFGAPILQSAPRFDLVVACEVLYYIRDVPEALQRMQQLARSCFVTYISTQHSHLASSLAQIPQRQTIEFEHNGTLWHAAWWSVA